MQEHLEMHVFHINSIILVLLISKCVKILVILGQNR